MRVARLVAIVGLSFLAGAASQGWLAQVASAQGQLQPLKQVDLGAWCPGKEVSIVLETIGTQHQSRHFHNAYSFAWMIAEKGKPLTVRQP